MNKLLQTIKEGEEEFDNFVYNGGSEFIDEAEGLEYLSIPQGQKLKSFVRSNTIKLLEEQIEWLEGKKEDDMVFNRPLTAGGGYPDYKIMERNKVLDEIISMYKETSEELRK